MLTRTIDPFPISSQSRRTPIAMSREASPDSTGSALSNITIILPSERLRSSTVASTTPPTSFGDSPSIISETPSKQGITETRRRSLRVRNTPKAVDQQFLDVKSIGSASISYSEQKRRVSDEGQHVSASDPLGDAVQFPLKRKSSRLSAVDSVIKTSTNSTTSIGKAIVDRSKGKLKSIKKGLKLTAQERKPGSSRNTSTHAAPTLIPPKPQVPKEQVPNVNSTAKMKNKRWEKQGLYVGQQRSFDSRRNESKNKGATKRKSAISSFGSRDNTALPLPIFSGEKLLNDGERPFLLPFDVFCPLATKVEPKFRHIEKNTFESDAPKLWKKKKEREFSSMAESKCNCTQESACDEDCHNRRMNYECDDRNCNVGSMYCTNRVFTEHERRKKGCRRPKIAPPKPRYLHEWASKAFDHGVEVVETPNRGYGVRAVRPFDRGQLIMEYLGEVIEQSECDRRMNNEYKNNENHYVMTFSEKMIIDATIKGSTARFINHSCEPNCEVIRWTVNGEPRMGVFAMRNIMTGEELTYDYNFENFGEEKPCHCGAENCRGILGPKIPLRDTNKSDNHSLAGTKRKLEKIMGKAASRKEGASSKRRRIMSLAKTTIRQPKNTDPAPDTSKQIAAEQKSNRDSRAKRRSVCATTLSSKPERQSKRLSNTRYSLPLSGSLATPRLTARSRSTIERFIIRGSASTSTTVKDRRSGHKANVKVSTPSIIAETTLSMGLTT